MRPFAYARVSGPKEAIRAFAPDAHYLAGGTNLLDLMKEGVERPAALIDVTRLALTRIGAAKDDLTGTALSTGALARNSDAANHLLVRRDFPLISQAIHAGASAQIRNMATIGGNLNQRTRCPYFYEPSLPCNKRAPGTGCSAREGINRGHAIFGWSDACVAIHPSDMCVALVALDAEVDILGIDGETRRITFAGYHRLPGDEPQRDNRLEPGDLITAITVPGNGLAGHSCYLKVCERTSYAFALVSVAAALELRDGRIADARLAMGGVSHKPWRAAEAERLLRSRSETTATRSSWDAASSRALCGPRSPVPTAPSQRGIRRWRRAGPTSAPTRPEGHRRGHIHRDFAPPRLAYAVLVTSKIAKGRITRLDAAAAEAADGVIRVLTHRNAMRLNRTRDVFDNTVKQPVKAAEETTNTASRVLPLESDRIHYWGQIVAVVVAESFEAAQAAADLVAIDYEAETPACSFRDGLADARPPTSYVGAPVTVIDGNPEGALLQAERRSDRTYSTSLQNHHPMEMPSTLAEWRGDELFVEEPSRYVQGAKRNLAQHFGLADDKVHVRARFVGGAFGSKGAVRPHVALAAMAAKMIDRPVRLLLTRREVTSTSGHRPDTLQRVALGADADGRLASIIHQGFSSYSATDPFMEPFSHLTAGLYAAPSRALAQKIVFLNVNQPTNMRGPGETTGINALESAMDELAHDLSMDPLELRRRNEPATEPITGKAFSCPACSSASTAARRRSAGTSAGRRRGRGAR